MQAALHSAPTCQSIDMTYDGYGYIAIPIDPSKPSVRIEATAHAYFATDEHKRLLRDKAGLPIDRYGVSITARATSHEKAFFKKYIHSHEIHCAPGRERETLLILAGMMIDEMVKQWSSKGYVLHKLNEMKPRSSRRLRGNTTRIGRGHGRR